ncbi:BAG family molecular chaperone regulator 1-like isoform X2 [Palaemon carinicauda]|uniref:BAG family molecular chaperone regulator 1-like isoform X2 n=1 Tax=Palaemon carinicauda TaxID=392227 RepID=UPI0035B59F92
MVFCCPWKIWRFGRSSPAKMGDEEYRILLCHGSNKYELSVCGAMTLSELSLKIEAVTGILHMNQKILFKGKNLTEPGATLGAYGITPGCKVMVLGKRFDPSEDTDYQAVVEIENSCSRVESKLNEIIPQISGIHNGYLDSKHCGEALGKLRKELLGVNEDFMRLLEQLDGLSFEEGQGPARQKRKSVVKKIQQLMERSDQLHEDINHLIKSYS